MVRARPITSFLLVTFGVSYALGMPFNAAVSSLFHLSGLAGLYLPRLVTVIGPAIAAILVARAGGGVVSDRQLLGSLRLRSDDVWWVAASAVAGLMGAGAAFVFAGVPLQKLLEVVATDAPLLFGHVLIQVTMIGVGEELGWRGWLLPNLSANRSFLAATAITGLAWTAWHLPLFLSGLSIAIASAALLSSLTAVFSWLWQRTSGGTGVVALAHGLANAPFFFLEQLVRPMAGGDALTLRAFACFAGCYGAAAIALSLNRRHIWRAHGYVPARLMTVGDRHQGKRRQAGTL